MRILIAYNGSDNSNDALDDLRRAGFPEQAEALILSVAEECLPPESIEVTLNFAAIAADRIRVAFPNWSVVAKTACGDPAREIVARSESFRSDLIILGEHDQVMAERNTLLSRISRAVISEAACSVRVARGGPDQTSHAQKIVVGFDGSAGSEFAVASIASRNWPSNTEVCLLAVADSSVLGSIGRFFPQMKGAVLEAKFVSQWAETLAAESIEKLRNAGLKATIDVRIGHPKETIIEMAKTMNADNIFVGPHCSADSFERFLLGSVSAAVAAEAHCSVEVVRQRPIR